MAIEVSADSAVCFRCGMKYGKRRGYFPVSYAAQHKGVGFMPICRECLSTIYNTYLSQCDDPMSAVRQTCRKLDLYWNEDIYNSVTNKSTNRSVISQYISKINSYTYAGKCYDDTLSDEGVLWDFNKEDADIKPLDESKYKLDSIDDDTVERANEKECVEIPEDVIMFWGSGYSNEMYHELEQRRQYWLSKFPKDMEIDIGTEALIRQICPLELDINRDRIAGKPVDKNVSVLNTLLGSANLKPTQQKTDADNSLEKTPFGVWIRRWEHQRPIPEPDPELQDVDGIIRYISIWFFGHLCKMLGIKNAYCRLYEQEIAKMRVDKPEYEGEDDEAVFNDVFGYDDEDSEYGDGEDVAE